MRELPVNNDIASLLQTGNAFIDSIICILIPMVLKALIVNFSKIIEYFDNLGFLDFLKGRPEIIRSISFTQRYSTYGYKLYDCHQKNKILQKAVLLYLGREYTEYSSARVELIEKLDQDDDDNGNYKQIKNLGVGILPPFDTWVYLEDDIEFRLTEEMDDDGGQNEKDIQKAGYEKKIIFEFKSSDIDSKPRINEIVTQALAEYKEMEKQKEKTDGSRYLYIMSAINMVQTEKNVSSLPIYQKYKLGEEKTFDTLFFKQKKSICTLLDNFLLRKGKFSIKGFPQKLGLLLHGPPGTGKTSLIKAIAHHTRRHILSVSLSKIQTNQELMDVMFNLKFTIKGNDLPEKLSFNNVIFVMEDIDCASSIVSKRETRAKLTTADDYLCQRKFLTTNGEEKKTDEESILQAKQMAMLWKVIQQQDSLNLAGLLNVLDGVIDSPGRIVIMTTNHIENLDSALIRPGRINKKVFLSYLEPDDCKQMLEHYFFCELNEHQISQLENWITKSKKRITAAELEQLCAEYRHLDELLSSILPNYIRNIAPAY